jgi:hypothetical protein
MPKSPMPTRTKTLDRTISSLVASTSYDADDCAPCQQRAAEQTARTLAKLAAESPDRTVFLDDAAKAIKEAETFGSNPSHSTDPNVPTIVEAKTARWAGVLGFEGEMTGDGRFIAPNAITWAEDEFPLPLRIVLKDEGAHRGAEVVGTIDVIERDEETGALTAEGDIDLGSEIGRETHRLMSRNMMNGVSLDLDDVSFEVRVAADVAAQTTALAHSVDPEGADEPLPEGTVRIPVEADGRVVLQESKSDDEVMVTTGARARAATIVAVPAFSKARIALTNPEALAASGGSGSPSTTDYTLDEMDKTFNWVDDVGGLPKYIKRIADHLKAKGMTEGHAIATAVNAVKKSCATGDLNYPGKQNVNAGSRAKACEALASWEAKKAKARADSAMTDMMAVVSTDPASLADKALDTFEDRLVKAMTEPIEPVKTTKTPATKEPVKTMAQRPITARKRQARNARAVTLAKARKSLVADGWNPVKQPRVPKGNGRLSGRWVDTPTISMNTLRGLVQEFEESAGPIPDDAGKALDKAFDAVDAVSDADLFGTEYESASKVAVRELKKAEAALDLFGETEFDGDESLNPGKLAYPVHDAYAAIERFNGIDWSLVGEENQFEGEGDIGSGDDDDFGDLETDEPAPGFDTGVEYEPDAVSVEEVNEGLAEPESADVIPGTERLDMGGELDTIEGVVRGLESDEEIFADAQGQVLQAVANARDTLNGGRVDEVGEALNNLSEMIDWMTGLLDEEGREDEGLDFLDSVQPVLDNLHARVGQAGGLQAAAAPLDPNLPHPKFFANPNLSGPTPLTVTEDGHVFGHIAVWGTCHISHTSPGKCVTPPKTASDYAYFHTGETVLSDGRSIPTGKITLNTGHASPDLNSNATLAHYDNTGTAVADVRAGEDRFGLWVSGTLRPGLSPERVRSLRSSPISGDWRRIGGNLELVAALAVNVPGFPVPRPAGNSSQGRVTSLVAAGMLPPKRVKRPDPAKPEESFSKEDLKYLIRLAREMKDQEQAAEEESRKATLAKASALANKIKAQSLAAKIKPNLSQKDLALTYDASTTSH